MKKETLIMTTEMEALTKELGAKPMTKQQLADSQKLKGKVFQTKKYREGLKFITSMSMKDLMEKHPDWPLNIVISKTIEDVNPDIPSGLLLEVVSNLVGHWEKSQQMRPTAA